MENKEESTRKNQVHLMQEINKLEMQVAAVQDKIHTLDNEEKLESYMKNFLEARKDYLQGSIKFYQKYSEKTNTKLAERLTVYLKFSVAQECYDKLLQIYREKYLKQESSDLYEDSLIETNVYGQKMYNLNKETESLTSLIEANSIAIKSLLKDLQLVAD